MLVTRNTADFVELNQIWHDAGMIHHGLILVTERAFPQTRDRVGSLGGALLAVQPPPPGGLRPQPGGGAPH